MLNYVKEGNDIIGQIYDVWPPIMRSEKTEQEMTRIGSSAAFHNTIGPFPEEKKPFLEAEKSQNKEYNLKNYSQTNILLFYECKSLTGRIWGSELAQ